MRFSVEWLEEYVESGLSPEELSERLTELGVEVDRLFSLGEPVSGLAAGVVTAVSAHPGADRLSLCQVDAGGASPVQVVCGAPNVRVGLTAPFAPAGAVLSGGLAIRAAKIRGEMSRGMLCSEKELGISEEAGGLMELPDGVAPGTALSELLGLGDSILDVDAAVNRPDCMNVFGLAREISAKERVPLRRPEGVVTESAVPVSERCSVEIEDPDLCPRYAARVIEGVQIGPSPLWMQRRLRSAGMRPINNVVDATNYVLMELGHPLHAFDLSTLSGRRIVVRRARAGERLTTLDKEERTLSPENLVIADAERAVAAAGVMGGFETEVTDGAADILLESAYFDPVSVRLTSKALGLQTEASKRFERGADPLAAVWALDRAAALILETAGGRACAGVVDCHPKPPSPKRARLRPSRLNGLLGAEIPPAEIRGILERLGFEVSEALDDTGAAALEASVPTYRPDIAREADLIEEAARVWGYDRIPATLPVGDPSAPKRNAGRELRLRAGELLRRAGLSEAMNMVWDSPDSFDDLGLSEDDPRRRTAEVENPVNEERSVMRTTLLPSLMRNAVWNHRHQVESARLYELQRVFWEAEEAPEERWTAGGVLWGDGPKRWDGSQRPLDFFDVKGAVESLLDGLGVSDWSLERSVHPSFHPGRSARLLAGGVPVGDFGEAHPDVTGRYKLPGRAYLFELDLEPLFAAARLERRLEPVPSRPGSFRDLTVELDASVSAGEAQRVLEAAAPEAVRSARLISLYDGEGVAAGKKRLTFALHCQLADRTLTSGEVDAAEERVVSALRSELGAERFDVRWTQRRFKRWARRLRRRAAICAGCGRRWSARSSVNGR